MNGTPRDAPGMRARSLSCWMIHVTGALISGRRTADMPGKTAPRLGASRDATGVERPIGWGVSG